MHSLLRPCRLAGSRGFTLIELMIVLLIIGVLLALGLAKFKPASDAAKSLKAQAQVSNALKDASAYYSIDETFDGMTAEDLSSVQGDVVVDSCDAESDQAAVDAATETTLAACADGENFSAAQADHAGNVWSARISDGAISPPVKNPPPPAGTTCYTSVEGGGEYQQGHVDSICLTGNLLTFNGTNIDSVVVPEMVVLYWKPSDYKDMFGDITGWTTALAGGLGCNEAFVYESDGCFDSAARIVSHSSTALVVNVSGIRSYDLTQVDRIELFHHLSEELPLRFGNGDITVVP